MQKPRVDALGFVRFCGLFFYICRIFRPLAVRVYVGSGERGEKQRKNGLECG